MASGPAAACSVRSILAALQEELNIHANYLGLVALGFLTLMPACTSVDVPSTSAADIATIVAATQRAAPAVISSPTAPRTATAAPTLPPTPIRGTPESRTRVVLLHGASSAVINAHVVPGESQNYVVRGNQAQPFLVRLDSAAGDAALSMMSQGGTFFLRPGAATYWRGVLPQTGDYHLGVYGGAAPTDYTLSVQQAKRIRFKEGASAATVSGKAPNGSVATYSLFGAKAERLFVTLSGAGRQAALSVSGFVDGHPYLSASDHKTTLTLDLPVTQDYIIEIVPAPGRTVRYILDVKIE
ncbi:MAG: hypothetical protein V1755_02585 [Chloroflexota bacterium]